MSQCIAIHSSLQGQARQDDWDAYSGLVEELGKTVQIVGDDLCGTQHRCQHRWDRTVTESQRL